MTGSFLSSNNKESSFAPSLHSIQPVNHQDAVGNPNPSHPSVLRLGTINVHQLTRKKATVLGILGCLSIAIIIVVVTVPIVILRRPNFPHDSSYQNDSNRPIRVLYNFPDPGLMQVNGSWFSYGTNAAINDSNVAHIPVATSINLQHWSKIEAYDAMPTLSVWETGVNHWAPDVIQRNDGRFVLYYSGELKDWKRHHCIGAAISEKQDPLGPYQPIKEPLACPREHGGAIDPSPFRDVDGKLYVTYKVDGNSIGHGGDCNNGKKPIVKVPIVLQELADDGITPIGDPIEILKNEAEDGPLVEAPNIIRTDQGYYYLFFSSHCFTSPKYDIKYARSISLKGPYERAVRPLLKTGDFNLISPGGATASPDGNMIVFHAKCDEKRCMHVAGIEISLKENSIALAGLK